MEEPDDQTASLSKGSQECFETVCEPCSESELVKADGYCVVCKEFMCKQCIKSHKGMKMSRDHHIQGPEEMPKTKHSNDDTEGVIPSQDELNIECKQHKKEVIKYFCKNHKVVGCMDCITLTHRSCADIMRVEEASSDASVDTELDEFDRRLKAVAEGFRNMLQIAEKNHLQVDDQKEKLLQDIRQYKETIIKTLDNLSSKIETQLNSIIIDNQTKIDQLIKRCKALQEDVEITSNEFDSLRENNQRTKEFILMNQSQLQLAEWEKDWNDMVANSKPNHYSFCPDLNLRRAMQEVSEFGQLVGKVDAEQCGACKTMTVKTHIHVLSCGHANCDVCTDESDGKDRICSTCGKVTVRCNNCKKGFDEMDMEPLVCGHQPVCRVCSNKRDCVMCTTCGVTTVRCNNCKKDFDKKDTEPLVCGHQPACRLCSSKRDCVSCTTCGVITAPCKRCKTAVDKSSISTLACGHDVCLSCRKQQTEKEVSCTDCGLITGNQPPGSLQERTEDEWDRRIQVLEFHFPDGKQEALHPCPGKTYKGCKLICRLGAWGDGPKVYQMLKTAFERKLVCKIEQDKIVSNIELYQGSVIDFYTDVILSNEYISYISRVMKRLQELGITA